MKQKQKLKQRNRTHDLLPTAHTEQTQTRKTHVIVAQVPGSHIWVAKRLLQAEREGSGLVHQQLNSWCVQEMVRRIKSGHVLIPPPGDHGRRCANSQGVTLLEQIVGKAGDVVLMHPWLIHCGTTNLR